MTNQEKIRAMSTEELAIFLCKREDCNRCFNSYAQGYKCSQSIDICKERYIKWLNKEAKEK